MWGSVVCHKHPYYARMKWRLHPMHPCHQRGQGMGLPSHQCIGMLVSLPHMRNIWYVERLITALCVVPWCAGMDNGAGADPRRGQGYGQAQAYGQGQRWDEQRTGESAHARDAWGASGPGPRPDSRHDSRPSVWEVGGALGAGWHGASIATEAQEGRKRPRDEAERGESEGRGWMTRDVRYNGSVATDAAMGGVTADEGARVEGRGVHGVGANGVAGNGALRNPWETLAEVRGGVNGGVGGEWVGVGSGSTVAHHPTHLCTIIRTAPSLTHPTPSTPVIPGGRPHPQRPPLQLLRDT